MFYLITAFKVKLGSSTLVIASKEIRTTTNPFLCHYHHQLLTYSYLISKLQDRVLGTLAYYRRLHNLLQLEEAYI